MATSAGFSPLSPPALQGNGLFANSIAMLLVRLVLGWIFIYAGAGKAFGIFGGYGIEGTSQFIAEMKMPAFLSAKVWTILLAYSELLGGATVSLGLLARLGSIPLIISMLVAIAKVTGPDGLGGIMDPVKGFQLGYGYNLALLAMAAAVLIGGPGLISLDAIFFRRSFWARGAQPLNQPAPRVA